MIPENDAAPPRYPAIPLREAAVVLWILGAAELGAIALREPAVRWLGGRWGGATAEELDLVFTGAWRALDFILAAAILRFGFGRSPGAAGLHTRQPLVGLVWSANLAAALGSFFVLCLWGYGHWTGRNLIHDLDPGAAAGSIFPPRLTILLPVVAGVSPFVEEFLFRGLLHQGIRNYLPPVPAVAASAVLFALAHTLFLGIPLPLFQFLGGLVTAAVFERTRSLLAPVLIHAAGNAFFLLLAQWAP